MLKPCLWFLLVFTSVSVSAQHDFDLPDIGEPADNSLSPAEEEKIGAEVMGELKRAEYLLTDPEVSHYIRQLGAELADHSDANPEDLDFFVVLDRRINAFALPGGYIGINAGLLLAADSESELASVFAHEIAHVTQRHIARQLEANKGSGLATLAALLLAIIAGGGDSDVTTAAITVGMSAAAQRQINFTRRHEIEADRVGIHTLANSGFDPYAMASFFQKLEAKSRLYGDGIPEILRTHPVNLTRITESKSRAAQYPTVTKREVTEFLLMQARMRALITRHSNEVFDYYQDRVNAPGSSDIDRYGLALSHLRSGRGSEGEKILQELTNNSPDQVHYHMALGDAQLTGGRTADAVGTYRNASKLFDDYLPLTAAYADALIQNKEPARARQLILEREGTLSGEIPDFHRLLAKASDDLGMKSEALFRMAEYYAMKSDYLTAITQLEAALRLPELSSNDKARISTLLQHYKEKAPKTPQNKQPG